MYLSVAELHACNIDQGFLSKLGVGLLSNLYRAIDESAGGCLFVAAEGDRIAGFVAGGSGMGQVYRRLLAHAPSLMLSLLPVLLKPQVVRGVFDVLRHSLRRNPDGAELPRAELLSLAVAPADRGRGIAEDLYLALSNRFAADGHPAFRIVVGETLAPAHRFYRKMGARPAGRIEVHPGQESVIYVQSIVSTQAAP